MTITRTNHRIDGFAAVTLANGALSLTLIPELGGKISSLRDLRSDREWLWKNPSIPFRAGPYSPSYVADADSGGWDECFPSVAPCAYPVAPWQGASVADHGELWKQAPTFDVRKEAAGTSLRCVWQGLVLPYTFERTITLADDAPRLHVAYRATNHADAPMPFVWCIHPLIAIEPGMRLEVPSSARFNVGGASPHDLLEGTRALPFPPTLNQPDLDLSHFPERDAGVAIKLWSMPLEEGWTTLHADNGSLRMRWDVALLPQVAFWMNFGAWGHPSGAPYYNFGFEPCIGAQDSLAEAWNDWHLTGILPPHGNRSWWLEIEL